MLGSRDQAARRVAIGLVLSLGVGAIAVAAWSLATGGIGFDSRFDTEAAGAVRSVDSSWTLDQAYEFVLSNFEFYGVFLYMAADALHLLATGSTQLLEPDDATTYLYQGAATLTLSVVAVTALAVALAVAFRSLLAGAFAWSLTLATPLWLGMSHVDFKDMPVAAGITLVTAGLVFSLAIAHLVKATIVGAVVAGAGGAVALSTRAGALPLLVALLVGTVVWVVTWGIARRRLRATLPVVATALSALVCAFVFTWSINPIAQIAMLDWLYDAIDVARAYPWNAGPIRVAGIDVRSVDLPWWYVPAWLWAQLPLLTLVTLLGGVGVLAVMLIRRRELASSRTTAPLVPIVLQAAVLPLGVVLSGAVLYDGIRHLLFMIPALVALPAVALAELDRRVRDRRPRSAVVLPLAAVLVVAASACASVRWAPYAYAYVNPIAGRNEDGRSWELDYWGVSAREGIERLRGLGLSPVRLEPPTGAGLPYGAVAGRPLPARLEPGLYVFLRWSRAADFGCTVVFTIERDGHVLGEGARCPTS